MTRNSELTNNRMKAPIPVNTTYFSFVFVYILFRSVEVSKTKLGQFSLAFRK